ncbi:hypothetical protein Scep_026958 [Stephania cephalantha]|uniref:Uncharacterized protein n=1 Tax=Stephania cephalantha TaxID=152367 RepID=A0AAP0HQZ6_9MAGN
MDAGKTIRETYRSPWKAISELYDEFQARLEYSCRNGTNISFLQDIWLGVHLQGGVVFAAIRCREAIEWSVNDLQWQWRPILEAMRILIRGEGMEDEFGLIG